MFAMGADTPVFDSGTNIPEDWNGFPIMHETEKKDDEWLDGLIDTYKPVVRMVSSGDGELPIHRMLKNMISNKSPPFNDPFVEMHMNLWAHDGMYRVDYLKTEEKVGTQGTPDAAAKLAKLKGINNRFTSAAAGRGFNWYGLVTRTQKMDIQDMQPVVEQIAPLCDILRTLLHINGYVVHFDLHGGNMAVMNDGTAVIHDVGRMKLRDFETAEAPWELVRPIKSNMRVLRNVLGAMFQWPSAFMGFGQHYYIGRAFKNLRTMGEFGFGKETDKAIRLVDDAEIPANQALFNKNKARFEAWLDELNSNAKTGAKSKDSSDLVAKGEELANVYDTDGKRLVFNPNSRNFYKADGNEQNVYQGVVHLDNPFETRYYQIARIFDILSVLDTLSFTVVPGRSASVNAPKVAAKLIELLNETPPNATKEEVEKVVRGLVENSGAVGSIANDTESETNAAETYWKEVNEPRSGKKGSPPVASPPADAAAEAAKAAEAAEAAHRAALEDAQLAQGSTPPAANPAEPARTQKKGKSIQSGDKNIGVVVMSPEKVEKEYDAAVAHATLKGVALPDAILEEKPVGAPAAPPAGGGVPPKVGGSLGGVGTNAVTFVARVEGEAETLSFLPPPAAGEEAKAAKAGAAVITWSTTAPALEAVKEAAAAAGNPPPQLGDYIVGYVSKARDLKDKYETISRSSYAGHALLPISSYPCDFVGGVPPVGGPGYYDERDVTPEFKASRQKTVRAISAEADKQPLTCFILPKFKEKVEYLDIDVAIPAVLDVLLGLCIERDFVITDLHDSNMALHNGKGVTFDYDRLITKNTEGDPLANFIARIKEEEEGSMSLMQNQHVADTFIERRLGEMTFAMYFKIYDMLSVLSLLEVTCGLLPDAQKAAASAAVASCVATLKSDGDTPSSRESAVTELTNVLRPLKWPTTTLSSPLEAELKHRSVERRAAKIAEMKKTEEYWGVWNALGPYITAKLGLRRKANVDKAKETAATLLAKAKLRWEYAEAAIRALHDASADRQGKALAEAKAAKTAWEAATSGPMKRESGASARAFKLGGRRTFRRKGLPQLL